MVNAPLRSRLLSRRDEAVTDADRDDLSRRLNEAFAAGQVDQDDFTRLLDLIFSASTLGDLVPVADALPQTATYAEPAGVDLDAPAPGELVPAAPPSARRVALVGGSALVVLILIVLIVALFV